MSLKVAGIPLPLAAAGAAGAGWLIGHLSSRQESAAMTGAPAAPAPPASIDSPSASLDFGQDLGPGVLPGVSPWNGGGGYVGGGGDGDYGGGYGGDPIPITGTPPPTPVPVTTAPPPTTTPPPPSTTPIGTHKLICYANFYYSASSTSRKLAQLPKGTIITVVAHPAGGAWSATNMCVTPHKVSTGSTWLRVSKINGKSVSGLYGTTYGYLVPSLVVAL